MSRSGDPWSGVDKAAEKYRATLASRASASPLREAVEEKFRAYKSLVAAVASGDIRFLLIGGGPGLGKTFEAVDTLASYRVNVSRSAGRTTPLAMYRDLYDNRTANNVVVFDDCDDAFKNRECLNILKAAADTRSPRIITWATSRASNTPVRYEFAGRIIIITNRSIYNDPMMTPLTDRAHCFELTLNREERFERIVSLLPAITGNETLTKAASRWFTENADSLHAMDRLTIRSAVKLIALMKSSVERWPELASMTILNG